MENGEVGRGVLLPGAINQAFGAGLLVCTMFGAVLVHYFILGPSMVPTMY